MQAPSMPVEDLCGGFKHGGWAKDCWENVMHQVTRTAIAQPYDLLLGRRTYELFANSFANANSADPIVTKLNNARKYVVSNTLTELSWHNSVQLTGDVVTSASQLKKGEGPLLQVHSSSQLVQT